MTLIGGSLMDSIGAKKLVLWFGLINCICGIGLAFASSLSMYLILRVVLYGMPGRVLGCSVYRRPSDFPGSKKSRNT